MGIFVSISLVVSSVLVSLNQQKALNLLSPFLVPILPVPNLFQHKMSKTTDQMRKMSSNHGTDTGMGQV